MKNTRLLIAFILTIISCNVPSDPEPVNVYKLNHVKEEHTYTYEYKFGTLDSSSKKSSMIKLFNSEGKSIAEEYYSRKLKDDYTVYPPKFGFIPDTLFINRKYQLKDDGEIVETISRNSGEEFTLSNKATYDNMGRQLELVVYDDQGNVEGKTITKYDGVKSIEIEYDQYGKVKGKTVRDKKSEIKYDAESKVLIEQLLVKESKGYLEYSKKDSTGMMKITKIESDTTTFYNEFDVNGNEVFKIKTVLKNGLIINRIIYSNGEPQTLYVHEYKFFNK